MALTAKAQYACLAMIQLAAERDSPDPTPLRLVADRHGIPPTFLVQILNQLKRAGLVSSVRGAAGGYRLQGDPATISLAQVVDAIEPADPPACAAEQSPLAPAMVALGRRLHAARRRCLAEVTLEELAAQAAAHAEPMWYI
jgi:Rrf2 family protein